MESADAPAPPRNACAAAQADASAAALAPAPPNLEALMQAWTPEMQAHIAASPLPDPGNAACDLPTFARMCCGVLDIPTAGGGGGGHAGLLQGLHALFALYLVRRGQGLAGRAEATNRGVATRQRLGAAQQALTCLVSPLFSTLSTYPRPRRSSNPIPPFSTAAHSRARRAAAAAGPRSGRPLPRASAGRVLCLHLCCLQTLWPGALN